MSEAFSYVVVAELPKYKVKMIHQTPAETGSIQFLNTLDKMLMKRYMLLQEEFKSPEYFVHVYRAKSIEALKICNQELQELEEANVHPIHIKV